MPSSWAPTYEVLTSLGRHVGGTEGIRKARRFYQLQPLGPSIDHIDLHVTCECKLRVAIQLPWT